MHMYKTVGQDMRNRADDAARHQMLTNARNEAKADAAVSFSSRLDLLATHAAVNHLSSVEIIELLRLESEKLDHQARAAKMGACNV
ncbi:Protein of uncharacterised function (DUF2732) [Serratia ficaria]|uniref:DUF2732 family protein n=1 Tax=Serratia ficaria TaxID=61651 RepID=UPI0021791BDA|nr:Protein of uncharacterised function (DUF2732) [Serratia ficaria]CAI1150224.1 Protein of uncharacterised function (DUF2732) [Serratia ficaria]CAI1813209.1 Protein of uncharacterised function (DUF2732) [Serratia ficaria]CAI2008744.1 Protein of uncharacterised function (DUF2732) [Serratia ficaria]CAI2489121.1 Protein of uncharacterised function (DUF2732) [Serratia ficaria]